MRPNRSRWKFTTKTGALLFVLRAILCAGSSQQNAAAYVLLFALTSIGIVSIPHAVLNVSGLSGRASAIKPTFAGQEASLPVEVSNACRSDRVGLKLRLRSVSHDFERIDRIPGGKATRATLRFPATLRGEHEVRGISVETTYPIGLVRIEKSLPVTQRYVVYPKPAGDPNLPSAGRQGSRERRETIVRGGEDFAGVREYIPGESQRHIDWKAVARGQSLMTKQFTTEPDSGPLYLDFKTVKSRHVEDRLSQLALWIIEAERAHRPYGLRLPNVEISPSLGDTHFHHCLRTLALFR